MQLGLFAGPIYTIILIVDCLFFLLLEWWMPREDMDFVQAHWNQDLFAEVEFSRVVMYQTYTHIIFSAGPKNISGSQLDH
jgi:hypothetical protein